MPPLPKKSISEIIQEVANLPIDSKAREEQKDIVSSSKRKRREANTKHWAFVVLIWIVVLLVGIAFIFKVWHLLMPSEYCWLDETHMKKIDDFLATGILSGGVGAAFRTKIAD